MLPIGPNKELAELFASSLGMKKDEYSLILAYQKSPQPQLSSTLKAGPNYLLHNFPEESYKNFVKEANLDPRLEHQLAELVREIFSQGLIEETRIPTLADKPLFDNGNDIAYMSGPKQSEAFSSTRPVGGDAEKAEVTSEFMASSTASVNSKEQVSVDNGTESNQEPSLVSDEQPWWKTWIIPSFFKHLKED